MGTSRFGLLGRILLALLAVGLLPLGIVSYRLLDMNRDAMTEQVLRTHAVAARTTAARVEAFLAARRAVASSAAAYPTLGEAPRSPESTSLLSELLRSSLEIVAVSVRNPAGEEVVRVQRKERSGAIEDVLGRPGGSELTVVRREVADTSDFAWLRLEVPLAENRGRLWLVCDLSPLSEGLRPEELGELTDLVLAERNGTLVLGSTNAFDEFPEDLVTTALAGKISGSGRFDQGGEVVLGAYTPVAQTPWVVLSRQPARVAEATAHQMRRRALLAVGVAALLALVVAAIAQRSMLRPLRELIEAQRRLAGPSEDEKPAAGGEIEQLKASFELLERRLQEKEDLGKVFLGRYQVMEVVGAGAMGTVFRGWDPTLERPVALKTVRFDSPLSPERAKHAASLLHEAVAVARFNHPNIVGIYDVQDSPEVAFLAMEFVEGECLESYLEQWQSLPSHEVVTLSLGIARGLAAAHARGILHRDIKPANVLLSRDGAVKIADFGISEMISSLSDEESIFGTPGFIPPETLGGHGYHPAGDLFALGVTLYQLLTGRLPFTGKNLAQVLAHTVSAPITAPSELDPSIPPEMDRLVLELLERNPNRRLTASEAARRLEILATEPDAAWVPRFPETSRKAPMHSTRDLSRSQLLNRARQLESEPTLPRAPG